MTSNQPYLIRAFYEWIVDNELTPYLVVDAYVEGTSVPQEHVKDGQIVLNISPSACNNLIMNNELISFDARFGGVPRNLVVPCKAALAIYARENGAGTVFAAEEDPSVEVFGDEVSTSKPAKPETQAKQKKPAKKGPPNLTIIK